MGGYIIYWEVLKDPIIKAESVEDYKHPNGEDTIEEPFSRGRHIGDGVRHEWKVSRII